MSLDSYYAMTAAKRNGTNADDEMEKLALEFKPKLIIDYIV